MNERQTEYRRQQSLLVEQLCRINHKDTHSNYGLAGRLLNDFKDVALPILQRMPEGANIAYIRGAMRREQEQTADFTRLNGVGAAWTA